MTYEQWVSKTEHSANGLINCAIASVLMDWTADRKALQTEVNRQHEGWTDTYEILADAARDAAYQRLHRKWLIREARAHHARAEMWYHKCKEYEAFNAPLKRVYNENTAEEVTP